MNPLARDLTSEAIDNFDKIDHGHTGTLNLADVARYETEGPEQKRVGQFIADNFGSLRGASDLTGSSSNRAGVSLADLQLVNNLSSGDPDIIQQQKNLDALMGGTNGALAAAERNMLPSLTLASSGVFGPLSVLGGAGTEAVSTAVGYRQGAEYARKHDDDLQYRIANMKP